MRFVQPVRLFVLLFLLPGLIPWLSSAVSAQAVAVQMVADTQELRIGEVLNVSLRAAHQPDLEVLWPSITDTLGGFEVLGRSPIQETLQNGQKIQAQQLQLIAFDSGSYQIPAVVVPYRRANDSSLQQTSTLPIPIQVYTVAVDTTEAIKPIKEIVEVPITAGEILTWGGLGLLILLILGGAYWWWKKRQEQPVEVKAKPIYRVPPHETAMRALARLESDKLWQQGEIKAYYSSLTDILRHYLEEKFEVPALESITDEIVRSLQELELADKAVRTMQDLLQRADLAKFAKFEPSTQDNMDAMEVGREFIRSTKDWAPPVPEPEPEPIAEVVPSPPEPPTLPDSPSPIEESPLT